VFQVLRGRGLVRASLRSRPDPRRRIDASNAPPQELRGAAPTSALGARSIALLALLVASGCAQERPAPVDLRSFESRIPRTARDRSPPPSAPWQTAATLTLAQLLAAADESNPEIAAERQEIDVATAAVWEARLYPNPTLLLEYEDYPLAGHGNGTRRAGVRVPIVIGDRLRAGSRAAELEREVTALRFLWKRQEVLLGVRKAYVDLLAARRARDAARESRDVAKSLADTAAARLAAQVAPEVEVLRSSVELSKAEAEFEAAEATLAGAGRTLEATVGPAGVSAEHVVGELSTGFAVPTLDTLRARVEGRNALEEIARAEQTAARAQVAAAQAERTPDIELEARAGQDGEGKGVVSLGIGIPLPFNNRNEAKIASTEARSMQAASRMQAARQEMLRRLIAAHRSLSTAQVRVTRFSTEALPTAERSLAQVRLGFEKGKLGYLDVIDARRTLSETKAAHAAALADLNRAAAELEALTGVELSPIRPK